VIALLSPASVVTAQLVGDRAESTAMVATSPVARGSTLKAAVEIRVAEGFHVNANPASEDFLIATEVSLAEADGFAINEVFYPPAHELTFGFWDGPLRVWEGSVVAGVVLEVADTAAIGFRDLEFVVLYQACNDEACFAPVKTTYVVAVDVVEKGSATRALESPMLSRARFERQQVTAPLSTDDYFVRDVASNGRCPRGTWVRNT
jgi:hypothetical protein